ncbi:MAG TPA: GNAT family N-acetyltransferase [Gemmatimonadota bacterium]|jgi:predicted GNAT family acetyltransferase
MELHIAHDTDHNRFVARTAHGEATLKYTRSDADTLDYRSTFVPEQDRGRGVGEALVLHALDWAEENDFQVIPSCPFVRRVLAEHPERSKVNAG